MIEIDNFVTGQTVEHAYGIVLRAQKSKDNSLAQKGMRAAKARDPKLLKALEGAAEAIDKVAEGQYGRTMRSISSEGVYRVTPTEAQLFREAYRTVDEGTPVPALAWMYAAGGILAGIIS